MAARAMVNAYLEAAAFTECGPDAESRFHDATWSQRAYATAEKACEAFYSACFEKAPAFLDAATPEQLGHDLWLTRNGHGVGYWENDYGTPEDCKAATEIAKAMGEQYVECYRKKLDLY